MQNKNLARRRNNLLQARRRSPLESKQIAFLLSKKSVNELYRYENGNSFPNLPTALMLEIVYRTPVRLLFQDLFAELQTEIAERRKSNLRLFPDEEQFPPAAERLLREEYCFFAEILKTRFPSPMEREMIRKHIPALMNTLSGHNQGRDPFSSPSKS